MDRLRVHYAEPPMEQLEPGGIEEPAADEERPDDVLFVQAELDRLPLPEREALVLFYLHNSTVMAVLLFVLGAMMIGKGIAAA
jgi:hypothetical protein